jgi:hypothetical protein
MPFVNPPRCPNCDSAIALQDFWQSVGKLRFLAGADRAGVVCPTCGTPLRVLPGFAGLSATMALLLLIFVGVVTANTVPAGWSWSARSRRALWVGAGLIALSGFAVHNLVAPRLLGLRSLRPGEAVTFPLGEDTTERKAGVRAGNSLDESMEENRPAWTCAKCGEENPGNFDECWKCQAWRVGEAND